MASGNIAAGMEKESFLVAQFRIFYGEVARYKTRVKEGRLSVVGEQEASLGDATAEIGKNLRSVLERQALAVERGGSDYAIKVFAEAQYVMAALADDLFLHLEWVGRDAWQGNLLEAQLFRSHRAGEAIFERLEILLRNRNPVYRGLAEVYLLALGLGFQGRFRGRPEGPERLAVYRQRLFEFIYDRPPQLAEPGVRLFPQAHANTLDPGESRKLPYLRPWLWAFAALFLLWALLSLPLWELLTDPLEGLLEIINQGRA
jgi:type VI secretion system protein ImpK